MSAPVEVVLDIERDEGQKRRAKDPTGIVRGMAVVGIDLYRPRLVNWGLARVSLELPVDVAMLSLGFWRLHVVSKIGRYNCLAYMAAAHGRKPGIDELYYGQGPRIVPGKYSEVTDPTNLRPGAQYGLPDSDNCLVHGIVGTGMQNRHLEVEKAVGDMKYADTEATLHYFQVACGHAARLVALEPGGYRSSEVVLPAKVS